VPLAVERCVGPPGAPGPLARLPADRLRHLRRSPAPLLDPRAAPPGGGADLPLRLRLSARAARLRGPRGRTGACGPAGVRERDAAPEPPSLRLRADLLRLLLRLQCQTILALRALAGGSLHRRGALAPHPPDDLRSRRHPYGRRRGLAAPLPRPRWFLGWTLAVAADPRP